MKKTIRLITLTTALSICATALAETALNLNPKQIAALGITSAPLPTKSNGEIAGLPAQVVVPGNQLFMLSTPLAAMVEQVLVGVGDNVRKGQVLARLQSPAFAEAQRGLLQAQVQAQLAKENMTRDEALFKDGIIAESRYRTSRGAAVETQAALSERKQLLRISGMPENGIARLQSGNNLSSLLTITAPIDGVILEKSVNVGQRLDAAMPLFKIANLDKLDLEIQAPVAATRGLKVGAEVTIPAFSASGKLTAIGRSLTGANQTILLRAQIQHGVENLSPGQFVEASISTPTGTTAQWEIPNSAISHIAGKAVIFIVTPQGFRTQEVRIINEGAGKSVISGELNGDEKIAISGVSALKASVTASSGDQ